MCMLPAAMEFVQQMPQINLVDQSCDYTTYIGEVFDKRPSPSEIQAFRNWAVELQHGFAKHMKRLNSPVASVCIYIDAEGVFVVLTFQKPVPIGNAKKGAGTLLAGLPKTQQQYAAIKERIDNQHAREAIEGQKLPEVNEISCEESEDDIKFRKRHKRQSFKKELLPGKQRSEGLAPPS